MMMLIGGIMWAFDGNRDFAIVGISLGLAGLIGSFVAHSRTQRARQNETHARFQKFLNDLQQGLQATSASLLSEEVRSATRSGECSSDYTLNAILALRAVQLKAIILASDKHLPQDQTAEWAHLFAGLFAPKDPAALLDVSMQLIASDADPTGLLRNMLKPSEMVNNPFGKLLLDLSALRVLPTARPLERQMVIPDVIRAVMALQELTTTAATMFFVQESWESTQYR